MQTTLHNDSTMAYDELLNYRKDLPLHTLHTTFITTHKYFTTVRLYFNT